MNISITGRGWVTASGFGPTAEGQEPPSAIASGEPVLPRARQVFDKPLARYGRFDRYTRMGCAATALALRDAGFAAASEKRNVGIVSASGAECLETDFAYYRTTLEEGGALASPQLFSYTLPGIVLGECAVCFGLAGPSFTVGDRGGHGLSALEAALRLLEAGKSDAMLAGWIESGREGAAGGRCGALFMVLERAQGVSGGERKRILWSEGRVLLTDGRAAETLLELL